MLCTEINEENFIIVENLENSFLQDFKWHFTSQVFVRIVFNKKTVIEELALPSSIVEVSKRGLGYLYDKTQWSQILLWKCLNFMAKCS